MKKSTQWHFALAMILALAHLKPSVADKKYGPGVTDTEIKIGQTMPYSGPASAYSTIGKAEAAYFRMINEQGGVNGRKIVLISLDDGYTPSKTVEQTRKLVEQPGWRRRLVSSARNFPRIRPIRSGKTIWPYKNGWSG